MRQTDWLRGKKEIAEHCRITVETLTAWSKKYVLPITVINRHWYARKSVLDRWLDLANEKRPR